MDSLLKGDTFKFFVDEIYLASVQENLFGAVLIPNIDSAYFPPMHLRKLYFSPEFLSQKLYEYYSEKIDNLLPMDIYQFQSSIMEGNYHELPTHLFTNGSLPTVLSSAYHDILNQNLMTSPYNDRIDDNVIDLDEGLQLLNYNETEQGNLLVYCFNVGQGDSMLLIFPNKNVYIIDTNIYSGGDLKNYISMIKKILKNNGLTDNKVKGLIITHKHIDHLRGAEKLINSGQFQIEYFLMNFDYDHRTKPVGELLKKARKHIGKRINVNGEGNFIEGQVKVTITNPSNKTKDKKVGNNLNDSSIVLCLEYGESTVLLSGDVGFPVMNSFFANPIKGESLIKISHHGSRTGTNSDLLNNIQAKYAFISAGNHKGFRHPHCDTLNILNKKNVDFNVSKETGSMLYEITKQQIAKLKFVHGK